MSNPVLTEGRVAVVTGAAMGIGLATCKRLAERGMRICLADILADDLKNAEAEVAAIVGADNVMSRVTDVSKADELETLAAAVYERFGDVAFLMNNAATRVAGGDREDLEEWHRTMDVNFWSCVHGERAFLPRMRQLDKPGMIVNTGSKQGITNPPGNLIYNITKSAVKTYTEGLEHLLRNTAGNKVTAHLLVPGFTTTGRREHKQGAWMPVQVVDLMLAALENGDFYIICPDDEVTSEMDHKRMRWAAGDIIENRPALSRWHPDWGDAFNKSN